MPVNYGEMIAATVLAWPGVTQRPHRFGGIGFHYRETELGHLHGNSLCDILLAKPLRDACIASGKALPHHIHPESNWVSIVLQSEQDVADALEILERKYRDLTE